jgi:hypothetical protein
MDTSVQLATEVLAWWKEHQYDVDEYDAGDGYTDEMNRYDKEPTFVTLAKKIVKGELNDNR